MSGVAIVGHILLLMKKRVKSVVERDTADPKRVTATADSVNAVQRYRR